ncbi:PhoH family protein [Legionella sp. CNM-1927-20]|uniref:PhoH family protein n=1 Tax=Legionella sp. CNM-1927-20 TaxID=3422221 RepID=UPI00403A7CC7
MSSTPQSEHVYLPHLNVQRLANLCGVLHENILLLEKSLQLSIRIQQNKLILYTHSPSTLIRAKTIIKELYRLAEQPVSPDMVQSLLTSEDNETIMSSINSIKLSRKVILPRNSKQAEYLTSIDKNDIIFAVGPAGTGKTYLAVSKAIECFEKGEVQRLVFVRPAVEAGEKLGFLPGDLVEKVLPYLRPIYDAIYEMLGFKEAQKLIQNDVIEILPLAFMRGRTLNDAFIILDEAQNTTIMQMKMFLTRMGFGSKAVVTGDMTQVDLPKGIQSGLSHAVNLFKDLNEISIHMFTSREVVRHPLISRIVESYDKETEGKNG